MRYMYYIQQSDPSKTKVISLQLYLFRREEERRRGAIASVTLRTASDCCPLLLVCACVRLVMECEGYRKGKM